MSPIESTPAELWPLALWMGVVILLIAAVIALSAVTGPRGASRRRDLPYESGMAPTRQPALRFPVHFYLVALAFLVFDIEAAYLLGWAVAARDVGWTGYIEALVFVMILLTGLAYLWGKGAFEWGVRGE